MIFVGSKVFTHARYWQIKKYICMIFFVWGGGHLGAPRICGGGRAPPPPRPPVATPLGDTPPTPSPLVSNTLYLTTIYIKRVHPTKSYTFGLWS